MEYILIEKLRRIEHKINDNDNEIMKKFKMTNLEDIFNEDISVKIYEKDYHIRDICDDNINFINDYINNLNIEYEYIIHIYIILWSYIS